MSDATQENGQVAGSPPKQWAVICTGFIDGRGFPTMIATSKGKPAPVIVRLCADQHEAERYSTRLRNRHGKVKMYSEPDYAVTVPIYGIAETDLDVPAKRKGNPNAFGRGKSATDGEVATSGKGKGKGK